MKQSTPPFAWLGRYFEWVVLAGLLGLAAFFRFIDLTSLPPGLYTGEARIGLQALDLLHHGTLPGLDSYNQYAPLWVWLQALAVAVFGHNDWSLRVWPAVLGVLATGATWLWAKQWFTGRIAWIAALLVAVTPWSVTLSRSAMPTELIILLVPLTLWTVTEIYRRGTLGLWLAGAGLLTLSLLSGPLGWLLVASVTVLGVFQLVRRHELLRGGKARWAGLVAAALGFGLFGYLAGTSAASLSALPVALGLTAPPAIILENIARTLLMFNLRGDENFRHNFAAEPMLNAFVGLMFIFGILVSISRLHLRRYRILLLLFVILLAPAALSNTGVPNAAHAAAALPIVAVLAAVGISYMLELWYSTFPINS
ncbi:MAG TPA: glycosyltransferase family 39 protein, partial [Candidatus Saccharimonas sp.]|nr:glycosyltransferase family 39 protein [Candidatus Saccharimonas sp.]